jgi:hypothetical protein
MATKITDDLLRHFKGDLLELSDFIKVQRPST